MNVAHSSIVSEKSGAHQRLTSVYENHVKQHGATPSFKQLFESAREASTSEHDKDVISWLESVIGTPGSGPDRGAGPHSEQHQHAEETGVFVSPVFFPSEDSFHHLVKTLDGSQHSLDICVYTITDDQVSAAVIRALERGVRVRIITDDEKVDDQGSDVRRLAHEYKIPTRIDGSPSFMHHKFAVIDDKLVINGSYNWTKGARFHNREDLTLTNSAKAVHAFKEEFEKLWKEFEAHQL
ncbi:hypothetical protein EDD21DRAFT_403815 [Dissophora ornata]|nr:hypothetical protein BGZ58_005060 [Dissophora ornata]KAI8602251.1 hypothetical protein EDD21DRAFT_403815 [Dissophora ornata]